MGRHNYMVRELLAHKDIDVLATNVWGVTVFRTASATVSNMSNSIYKCLRPSHGDGSCCVPVFKAKSCLRQIKMKLAEKDSKH